MLCEVTLLIGEPHAGSLWQIVADSGHAELGWALLATFSVAAMLLLLNLLIGMLDVSYDLVRSKAEIEYAHGRSREVLAAAALPLVPPPLNLLQAPAALVFHVGAAAYHLACGERGGYMRRSSTASTKVPPGCAAAWPSTPKAARRELFAQAWEDVGWQLDPTDGFEAWKVHVSRELANAVRRDAANAAAMAALQQQLEAQAALLRAAVSGAPAAADVAPAAGT